MKFEEVKSPYDLEVFLRDWGSDPEEGQYDFGEVVAFLLACLDNLRKYALEAEIEDIPAYLTDEQANLSKKWLIILKKVKNDSDSFFSYYNAPTFCLVPNRCRLNERISTTNLRHNGSATNTVPN